ncbi:MAG TPA: hypothetical protein VMT35_18070 [Ignavibacteriaceae bacterium]|nr:hypothetical protein [Ignavibacteriaceae bacterium]
MKLTVLYLFFLCSAFPQSAGEAARSVPGSPLAENNFSIDDTTNSSEEDSDFDPGTYNLRKPSEEALSKFKKDKEFNYTESEGPANLLEVISEWINEQIANLIQSKGFGIFQEYLGYFIAAAALLIVIIILNKNKLGSIIYNAKDTVYINFREAQEDINKIDFDSLISASLNNREFKIAARYHYLKSLKLLSENKLIDWEINKTNKQYLYEIIDSELKKSFEELTALFEWIWYGDYPLEESFFYKMQKNFINFYGRLETSK